MMKLKRGGSVVLGLTDENIMELAGGGVLRVRGDEIELPGLTLYLVLGQSHEQMRADLDASGYLIPSAARPDGGDGDARHGDGHERHDGGDGHDRSGAIGGGEDGEGGVERNVEGGVEGNGDGNGGGTAN